MYKVVPLKCIGPVLLGMSREESRSAMGAKPFSFRKSSSEPTLADSYEAAMMQVFFDGEDRVEYIEMSARGEQGVIYKGVNVFETKADDLVRVISGEAAYDEHDPELGYSFIFPALELSLWRPALPESEADDEGLYFSTIGVGRKGYYSGGAS